MKMTEIHTTIYIRGNPFSGFLHLLFDGRSHANGFLSYHFLGMVEPVLFEFLQSKKSPFLHNFPTMPIIKYIMCDGSGVAGVVIVVGNVISPTDTKIFIQRRTRHIHMGIALCHCMT